MLQIILFLTTQLFVLSLSSTLSPMTPATELTRTTPTTTQPTTRTSTTPTKIIAETITNQKNATEPSLAPATTTTAQQAAITQTTGSLHNNVLVFLNEQPKKIGLRDDILLSLFRQITRALGMVHIITSINMLNHFILEVKDYHARFNTLSPSQIKDTLSKVYHINNSPYIIALPRQKDSPHNLLDLSDCTQICSQAILSEPNKAIFFDKVLKEIETLIKKISQNTPTLLKESTVFNKLFTKQINITSHLSNVNNSTLNDTYKQEPKPWFFHFIGHGVHAEIIAGFDLNTEEIWNTLKILNRLSINYLIITSCNAGGANRKLLTGSSSPMKNTDKKFETIYKNFEKNIISLVPSYKIIICSSTSARVITKAADTANIILETAKNNLTENELLFLLRKNDQCLNSFAQINKLPLIKRLNQTTFTPLFTPSKNKNSSLPANTIFQLTRIKQIKEKVEKNLHFIDNKSAIQTNNAIIEPGIIIKPGIKKLYIAKPQNRTSPLKQPIGYGHEQKILHLFPVESDTIKTSYTDENGAVYKLYPQFPHFLSLQIDEDYHYLSTIQTEQDDSNVPKNGGVFLALRDLFFNANMRKIKKLYFIKSIIGPNDIPQEIINKKIFDENFPKSKQTITLRNVAVVTYYDDASRSHKVECAFSCENSYYTFIVNFEDRNSPQEWNFIIQLPSQKEFEQKICLMEDLACSKIYDRLKSYPETHPQHELIKEYLDRKKSIFLDFENSYPLFKEDHLPDNDHAWEQLPELVKKHVEKQKGIGSIAEHQLNNQKTFAPILKKIKEYQKRPILEDHENGHPEDSHI